MVAQQADLPIEYLSLPGEDIDEFGNGLTELCSGRDDRGALGLAIRNGAGLMRAEQRIELLLRRSSSACAFIGLPFSSSLNGCGQPPNGNTLGVEHQFMAGQLFRNL